MELSEKKELWVPNLTKSSKADHFYWKVISLLTVSFLVVTVMLWFDERGNIDLMTATEAEHGKFLLRNHPLKP